MKTTMNARQVANPRRTTLAHLSDGDAASGAPRPTPLPTPSHPVELPRSTANPRRTVLTKVPAAPAPR